MPLLLPYIIILLSVLALLRNRTNRTSNKNQDIFWEKEQRANHTRKQDISGLDYIQIPLDTFPIGRFTDEKLTSLEQTLTSLSNRKILNLSGISNTDLKLQYGAANLPVLSECDANFTLLARTITAYGERLAELGHWKEAILILEFGIQCKTDLSKNYTLLGTLYRDHDDSAKIQQLVEIVQNMDLLLKDSILQQLLQ